MSIILDEIIGLLEDGLDELKHNVSINDIKENIQDRPLLLFKDFCEKIFICSCGSSMHNESNRYEDNYDDDFDEKVDGINEILDEIGDLFYDLYYSADEKEKTRNFIEEIINRLNQIKGTDFFIEYYDN